MATHRLPSLWPLLTQSAEYSSPAVRSARAHARMRAFHTTSRRRLPDAVNQRYGTANEPPPHIGPQKQATSSKQTPVEAKALPKIGEGLQKDGEVEMQKSTGPVKVTEDAKEASRAQSATVEGRDATNAQPETAPKQEGSGTSAKQPGATQNPLEKPVESLLDQVPDPGQQSKEQAAAQAVKRDTKDNNALLSSEAGTPKAPHINTPRYVHHFDTYGLVRRLEDSGWSNDQSVTVMKAVRLLLADNMDLAREALVSKSQVENESYLFRAACAELKTEVTARRKSEQEKMRTERNQLQHELDIVSQRLGQESVAMKDELKGMFDDRNMAVRNEQRGMESKIQRLNYQITVDLQADAKSEVEGLRWVMTRRVIIALATVVVMVLGSLKLYSNAVHEQELDAKRRANMKSGGTQTEGSDGDDRGVRSLVGGEMIVKEGDNPAFVSLG